jgi:hypothetical protein
MQQHAPPNKPEKSRNSGRIIGAEPPLKSKFIWAIRQQLTNAARTRDLALFNSATPRPKGFENHVSTLAYAALPSRLTFHWSDPVADSRIGRCSSKA